MREHSDVYAPYDKLDRETVACMDIALRRLGIATDGTHNDLTPYRLCHYLSYLATPAEEFHLTAFPNEDPKVSHMVTVPAIPFWSACSHHTLPFVGKVSVGYVPNNLLIGLSKIPLLVRSLARGFWVQEHLANTIADKLEETMTPQGVGVMIEAMHTCQLLDLKQPPIPVMRTTVLRGIMLHGEKARDEFYQLIAT